MGGLDVLTFTAGIGENDAVLHKELCDRLKIFGIRLDRLAMRGRRTRTISSDDSAVRVMVVPTNGLAIAGKPSACWNRAQLTSGAHQGATSFEFRGN